jgi:hypothetical protein
LPPKPTLKVPKANPNAKLLNRLAEIANKDMKEAITRWKQILSKLGQD